jgi:hypothetical protein
MADHHCHPSCAHWSRLPHGSGGYKAGRCAVSGLTTLAPHGCDAWTERPIDWAAWGLTPPAPRAPAPPPMTAAEARAATQGGLFDA